METKDIKMTPKWSKSKDEIWKDGIANICLLYTSDAADD